jgi:hypothetical protein
VHPGEDPRPDEPNAASETPPATQTESLIALGQQQCGLFHDARQRPYARTGDGQFMQVEGVAFRRFLQRAFRRKTGRAANAVAVRAAVEELAAAALFDGKELPVYLRTGSENGNSVIDVGDGTANSVVIEPNRWEIRPSPVAFERKQHSKPLLTPVGGGSIDLLGELLNLESRSDLVLVTGWLLMALCPDGPYPILVLQGEPGSAKSTTTKILKSLIDPAIPILRSLPRSERDLAVAAQANWVLAFDNVSYLPTWLSDAMCRVATGGGFGTRTHYANEDETVFEQMRPMIINGLDAVATRQDLLNRSIVLRLPTITRRFTEHELKERFAALAPLVLGALADGVAEGLARMSSVDVPRLPRMADFARWATAAEPSFGWEQGTILAAYEENQAAALRTSLEGSLLTTAIQRLLADDREIAATPTDLYESLAFKITDEQRRAKSWPRNAQGMSRQLTLLTPALRELGIEINVGTAGRDTRKTRWIEIRSRRAGDDGDDGDA